MYFLKVTVLVVVILANFDIIMSNDNDVLDYNQKLATHNVPKRSESAIDNETGTSSTNDESHLVLNGDAKHWIQPEPPSCPNGTILHNGKCRRVL